MVFLQCCNPQIVMFWGFCATGSRIGEVVGFPVPCVKDTENDVETRTTPESGSMEILEDESPSQVVLVQTGKFNPGQYREVLSEGDVEAERPIVRRLIFLWSRV